MDLDGTISDVEAIICHLSGILYSSLGCDSAIPLDVAWSGKVQDILACPDRHLKPKIRGNMCKRSVFAAPCYMVAKRGNETPLSCSGFCEYASMLHFWDLVEYIVSQIRGFRSNYGALSIYRVNSLQRAHNRHGCFRGHVKCFRPSIPLFCHFCFMFYISRYRFI